MREPTRTLRPPFAPTLLRSALLLCALAALPALTAAQTRAAPPDCDQLIASASRRYSLDYFIFRSLVNQESGCRPGAVSNKGAKGLTQLMPATAVRFGVKNPFDPVENVEGGARYLRWLLDYFGGDYTLALAGYNAGEGAVMKYGRRVPPYRETQAYVARILESSRRRRTAAGYVQLTAQTRPAPTPSRQIQAPAAQPVEPAPSKEPTVSRYYWQ